MITDIRVVALAASVLTMSACSQSLGKAQDWSITPQSDRAVVIMDAPPQQPYDVTLSFSKDGSSGFLSRVYLFHAPASYSERYLARSLKPGEYLLTSITQQSQWQSCFNNGTVGFALEPGGVYYLGRLNWQQLLRGLQGDARDRGRTRLGATAVATGWDPEAQPDWTYPSEDQIEKVREFAATTMPNTTSEVEPLRAETASFSADGTEKALQICG